MVYGGGGGGVGGGVGAGVGRCQSGCARWTTWYSCLKQKK